MKARILRTVAALAAGLVFAGLSGGAAAQTSRLDEIVKRDKLLVATFGTAPPFGFADDKGQLVGFDIDIAKLIAKYLLGDEKKMRTAKYRTCTQQGCIVDIQIDDTMQAALNTGKDGRLLFAGANDNKPIAIPLSLKGYGAAKRAYNNGEAKRASWFWRMWS